MQHCLRHMEEPSTAQCRNCHGTYCNRCLVFSFGPRKPPYCVGCALHASGVRPGSRKMIVPELPVSEMDASFGNPVAFDRGSIHGDGSSSAPDGGDHASPRVSRRARRQAEKEAARAANEAENTASASPDPSSLGADALEPVLAPAERRLLSRLTANRLAEV